jgi:DNA-binding transcriptional MerR regulator
MAKTPRKAQPNKATARNGNGSTAARPNRPGASHDSLAALRAALGTTDANVAGLRTDVNDVKSDAGQLTSRYDKDMASLAVRLGGHDRRFKLSDKRFDRLDRVIAALGERVATDHDMDVDRDAMQAELTKRFDRMEELVGKGFRLDQAAAVIGFTPDEVKEILSIQDEDDLTYEGLFAAMVDRIGWLQRQLDMVVETVAEQRRDIDGHTQQLDRHDDLLDGHTQQFVGIARILEDAANLQLDTVGRVNTLRTDVDNLQAHNRFKPLAAIIAGIVFLIGLIFIWLFFGFTHKHGDVHGIGSTANAKVGTWDFTSNNWVTDLGVLVTLCAVLFVALQLLLPAPQPRTARNNRRRQNNQNAQPANDANQGQNQAPAPATPPTRQPARV